MYKGTGRAGRAGQQAITHNPPHGLPIDLYISVWEQEVRSHGQSQRFHFCLSSETDLVCLLLLLDVPSEIRFRGPLEVFCMTVRLSGIAHVSTVKK
jgi:hypothetical protein